MNSIGDVMVDVAAIIGTGPLVAVVAQIDQPDPVVQTMSIVAVRKSTVGAIDSPPRVGSTVDPTIWHTQTDTRARSGS